MDQNLVQKGGRPLERSLPREMPGLNGGVKRSLPRGLRGLNGGVGVLRGLKGDVEGLRGVCGESGCSPPIMVNSQEGTRSARRTVDQGTQT